MEQVVSFLFKFRMALFEKSEFVFGARPSILVLASLAAAAVAFLYFLYVRSSVKLSTGWKAALIATRLGLIAVILFCLFQPVIVVPSVVPQSTYVAVLMDDSGSMLLEHEGSQSRLDVVRDLMSDESDFSKSLREKFRLRSYRFAGGVERLETVGELTGEGEQTDLAGSIQQVAREFAGLPLSGIVVITDGASNAGVDPSTALNDAISVLRSRGIPVHAIGVGQTRLDGDVELVRAAAPRRVLAGSTVTAELLIRSSGIQRSSVRVDLSENGNLLRTEEIAVQDTGSTVARISFTPSAPGLHRYSFHAVPLEGEPIVDNNSLEVLIEVQDANPRVLHVEGEPRWEYGKLRQALAEEKNVIVTSLLRSAEGKFYRQGVESGEELAGGFPQSEEELFGYDALVIGSVEATFFTFDQLRAIEQFVSRRGGTLLALGGARSFNAGGYAETPLADLLPVYLGRQAELSSDSQTFKASPAARGGDHPAARLVETADANSKAWELMPPISLPEILSEPKPGATVILEARNIKDGNRTVPLLVEQRYGRGRSLALMTSDTWRWRMLLESRNKSFETFWRNLLRHLVEGSRQPVEAIIDRSYFGRGEEVRFRVEVADEKYLNVADARLEVRLTPPTGDPVDISLRHSVDSGFEGYTGSFVSTEDGLHRFEVTARRGGGDQKVLGTAQVNFVVGPLNRESRDAAQNLELLKRIAAETGGNYYTPADGRGLIDDLTHAGGADSERVSYELWDMPINFLLIIGLAAAEWFIRKRKGLA